METTLNTLKNLYARELDCKDWQDLIMKTWSDDVMEKYYDEICLRAQKAALEKAGESARVQMDLQTDWYGVDRTSITNENNLIR